MSDDRPLPPISALSLKKQLAFALLVFERMLPSLIAFSKDTGFDDSCFLRGRDVAWSALQNGVVDVTQSQQCIGSAPDTEEFSHELTSCALNAALAMNDIMEFIADSRTDHVDFISTLAKDSIELYLSSDEPVVSSPEKDRKVKEHPLMQEEVRRQQEDAAFLSGLPDEFDAQTVSAMRARSKNQGSLLPLSPS